MKGAILQPVKAVIEAGISDFAANAIIGNIVKEEAVHNGSPRSPTGQERLIHLSFITYISGDVARLHLDDAPERVTLLFVPFA